MLRCHPYFCVFGGTASKGFFVSTIKGGVVTKAGLKTGSLGVDAIVQKLAGMNNALVNQIVNYSGAGSLFEGAVQVVLTDKKTFRQVI